jgi:hypothetical protein
MTALEIKIPPKNLSNPKPEMIQYGPIFCTLIRRKQPIQLENPTTLGTHI